MNIQSIALEGANNGLTQQEAYQLGVQGMMNIVGYLSSGRVSFGRVVISGITEMTALLMVLRRANEALMSSQEEIELDVGEIVLTEASAEEQSENLALMQALILLHSEHSPETPSEDEMGRRIKSIL